MTGYIGLTLWAFVPLIIAYGLYRLNMPSDFVVTIMIIGFLAMIYWILVTTVMVVFGIKKYIELGNMDLFIQEFLRSVRE